MAIRTPIPVNFEAYFSRGAFMIGEGLSPSRSGRTTESVRGRISTRTPVTLCGRFA